MFGFDALGLSDPGLVRRVNEDSFLVCRLQDASVEGGESILAIVADGVGGHAQGERASLESVQIIRNQISRSAFDSGAVALKAAVAEAHSHLRTLIREDGLNEAMGTTCTAAWLGNAQAYIAQVGDSRAYLLREGAFVQITEDQTIVQKLLREGLISEGEAATHPQKNLILQALGISDHIEIEVFHVPLAPGDVMLLCTDGLHGLVDDAEMVEIISSNPVPVALKRLINLAIERGGHDNITAVILKESDAEAQGEALADTLISKRSSTEEAPFRETGACSRQRGSMKKYLIIIAPILLGIGAFFFLNFHKFFG